MHAQASNQSMHAASHEYKYTLHERAIEWTPAKFLKAKNLI